MEREPLEVAWAAGLFEGEGCFTLTVGNRPGSRRVAARVGSTDRDVIERFARIIGFGHVNLKRAHKEGHKDLYEWSTQAAPSVRDFIELVRPYLGRRRREKAEEVYAAALKINPHNGEATHCRNGHEYTPENTAVEKLRGGKTTRRCRICRRGDARRWEAKRRSQPTG